KVSRTALVSGIIVIATNSTYQQAVPVAARKTCRPILSVRGDAGPPRIATGMMTTKQIRSWNSTTTAVDVSLPAALPSAPTSATQNNDSVVRPAPTAN